jgi:hypothetical protein
VSKKLGKLKKFAPPHYSMVIGRTQELRGGGVLPALFRSKERYPTKSTMLLKLSEIRINDLL